MNQLRELLEPIAGFFESLGVPEPIVHWGHPLMMGIVIFVMGSFVGLTGWQVRVGAETALSRQGHRQLAPWMFIFIAAGYTGGILSLVMQDQPILASPHFWTGSAVVMLLGVNAVLSLGFGKDTPGLRTAHAYLGSTVLCLMFLHALLGLKLGLSL